MSDTDNFTNRLLQGMQADLADIKSAQLETNRELGTLAEGMVRQTKRMDHLTDTAASMANDLRTVAIAVDEHTTRLEHLENKDAPIHT
jgi:septal ring factor EnvC (AmiA/AmiB activator)